MDQSSKISGKNLKESFLKKSSNIRKNELKFPKFSDLRVSTKTYIIITNLTTNIKTIFENFAILPRDDIKIIHKIIKGKKSYDIDVKNGSIITMRYENIIKGSEIIKGKLFSSQEQKIRSNFRKRKKKDYFRNSLTIVMVINKKNINFKISSNGKIQMTGCKSYEQAESCIIEFWKKLQLCENSYTLSTLCRKSEAPITRKPGVKRRKKLVYDFSSQTSFNEKLFPFVEEDINEHKYDKVIGTHMQAVFIPVMRKCWIFFGI